MSRTCPLAFPSDGNRYELVHGELLVTPAPAQQHQKIVTRLCAGLEAYVAGRHSEAQVFVAPADIIWGPGEYVQPDLCVVPADEVTGDWRDCQTLLLAVEVVSPGSAQGDRVKKRRLYQAPGVSTYWIVDPNARMVEVWRPDDERPGDRDGRPAVACGRRGWGVGDRAGTRSSSHLPGEDGGGRPCGQLCI